MKLFLPILLFVTTSLFGEVADPYRWLEEESAAQQVWLTTQKARSDLYFSKIPERAQIKNDLEEVANFGEVSLPERIGETLFYLKKNVGCNKKVLIRQQDNHTDILVDPNLSEKECNLVGFSVSPNEEYLAYGLAIAGSDQQIWHILDLKNNMSLPDTLDQIQFSQVAWDKFKPALYYIRNCQEVLCHQLGEDTSQDTLLYQAARNSMVVQPITVLEGQFILVMERTWVVKNKRYLLIDLWGDFCGPPYMTYELVPESDAETTYIGEKNGQFFFITDEDCCFGKLIAADMHGKRTVIAEQDSVLQEAVIVGDYLACIYYKNAVASLKIFDLEGNFISQLPMPSLGSISVSSSENSPYLYYSFTNFKTPTSIFSYNVETKECALFYKPELAFDPGLFITRQVWYTGKDGTSIPMFLTHHYNLKITENTPVLMYGYGGFNLAMTPHFRPDFMTWLQYGGILAVPNLRGGNEFGKTWYDQGRQHNKQNVFDDCIAAAEYLAANHIGSSNSLALFGTSNGGLLAGACLTQRPDLFRAVIANKGVLDMLRFHLFTVGKYWICDYGDPENPKDYAYLLSYSPYHNVRANTHYPAVLVNTADHDDRVVPLHSFKFAAALQNATASGHPILLRQETACGHGGRDSQAQQVSFGTDLLSFLCNELRRK